MSAINKCFALTVLLAVSATAFSQNNTNELNIENIPAQARIKSQDDGIKYKREIGSTGANRSFRFKNLLTPDNVPAQELPSAKKSTLTGDFADNVYQGIVPPVIEGDTINTQKPAPKKWYDSFTIRGYAQVRYNRLLETNPDLKCEQCDKSWGKDGGFMFRRARLIFSGQINKRVYFYIQPDLAISVNPSNLHFLQIRDAYFDLGLDKNNILRLRVGQSKVPYGFDNMQSSQNRLALDRSDALNSGTPNERDLGVFLYFTPAKIKERYAMLVKEGLKGTGDYGILGVGVYNGQTANKPELNDEPHMAARLSYPFKIKSQIIEGSLQGYSGKYVVATDMLSGYGNGIHVGYNNTRNYRDERAAASLILYPKPLGIQAEYTIGKGPEFNKNSDSIEVKNLSGGYVTVCYRTKIKEQVLIPFTRLQTYAGGKKHEQDARSHRVDELEIGIEWQPVPAFELTAMYTISSRRFEDFQKQDNLQKGQLLRLQAQVNF